MTETITTDPYAAMEANFLLPGGTSGDVTIKPIEVSDADASATRLRAMLHGRGYVEAGTYTGLYRRNGLWMSNTADEQNDHRHVISTAQHMQCDDGTRGAKTALVGGLGIGMVVAGLLAAGVKHIDVVEIDPDVVALVGPKVQELAAQYGATVTVHQADIYTITWPKGTHWDLCWMDVWQDLCADNLPQMSKLARSYGRRATWKGYWGREEIVAHQRRYGW